ncbi:MAG: hypothetical protein U0132_18430 [Gemmatimonadaceae bacterium]
MLRDIAVLAVCCLMVVALIFDAKGKRAGRNSVEAAINAGTRYADSLTSASALTPAESIQTRDAVAALYLERLRLGLGSPFRLIDQSQRDPLLPLAMRPTVGHALLSRTAVGEAYLVEPAALTMLSLSPEGGLTQAKAHLALIDSLVRSHQDPRVGELTVRLAYRLAFAAGHVSRRAPEIAIQAAAQSRDRVLAIRDARAVTRAALAKGVDALQLLTEWRARRTLLVERPVLVQLAGRSEAQAVEDLPRVVARIASIARLAPDSGGTGGFIPLLRDGLARRMAGLAELRSSPPEAPVAVTVSGYSASITGRSNPQALLAQRFVDASRNEETLAGEFALLRSRMETPPAEAAMAVLTAGVSLRPYAQERAWLPGESAPTVSELQTRYGLASIDFDANVPIRWRPYYRLALDNALTDMRRVFPAFSVAGLRVRFGESPLGDRALAMHDPVSRTVYFPVTSGAGVMAHEFAHDLDWQAARRRYGATVGYRTDRAVRQQSDWLAGAVRRMASAERTTKDSVGAADAERPTEVFARNVDWFVSAALARDARMNGWLSAAQDPVLTGYASATTPEAARDGGEATLRALDGISAPGPKLRAWFDGLFGAGRKVSVHESVRRVLEVPINATELRRDSPRLVGFDAATALLRSVPQTGSAWSCFLDVLAGRNADRAAARAVAQYAAESRARGIVQRWAVLSEGAGDRIPWRMRALTGGPWSPAVREQLTQQMRDAILWHALRDPGPSDVLAGAVRTPDAACSR